MTQISSTEYTLSRIYDQASDIKQEIAKAKTSGELLQIADGIKDAATELNHLVDLALRLADDAPAT